MSTTSNMTIIERLSDNKKVKRPKGRPRKYPKSMIQDIMIEKNYTSRGAQNYLNQGHVFVKITDKCSEYTQRFFFGGRTFAESGTPKFCMRLFVMQELGRFPDEDIPEIAEAIAHDEVAATWTQQEIVDALKSIRLNAEVV